MMMRIIIRMHLRHQHNLIAPILAKLTARPHNSKGEVIIGDFENYIFTQSVANAGIPVIPRPMISA